MNAQIPTLLIATRNRHKTSEIQSILGPGWRCRTLNDFPGAPTATEDAPTFAGNATRKAITLACWLANTGRPLSTESASVFVLADDSGLEVDALHGAPGVHSARFAALDSQRPGNSSDAENNAKLLRLLGQLPLEKRTARFRCVIALTPVTEPAPENASPVCYADELELQTRLFEGTCEGHIGFGPRGEQGFGYDPLFVPSGYSRTFAELSESEKNSLSHRSKALAQFKTALLTSR